MRTTNANRTERPANDQQTDPWSDALAKPTIREERHERVKRIADDAITRLADALEQGRSEALTDYLGAMSRFHRYSLHNVLLIAAQRPDATHVAGFRKWAEMERHVVKGAKGIAILAPLIRRARGDTSSEEGAGEEAVEPGGVLRGFRVVYVFDVTDTDGKPLPEFARVTGDPGEHLHRLKGFTTGKGHQARIRQRPLRRLWHILRRHHPAARRADPSRGVLGPRPRARPRDAPLARP